MSYVPDDNHIDSTKIAKQERTLLSLLVGERFSHPASPYKPLRPLRRAYSICNPDLTSREQCNLRAHVDDIADEQHFELQLTCARTSPKAVLAGIAEAADPVAAAVFAITVATLLMYVARYMRAWSSRAGSARRRIEVATDERMRVVELDVARAFSEARRNPGSVAKDLSSRGDRCANPSAALNEAIAFLRLEVQPVGALDWNAAIARMAHARVCEIGSRRVAHVENIALYMKQCGFERRGVWAGEMYWVGGHLPTGREVVYDFVVDEGVSDRSHRYGVFDIDFTDIGVCARPHAVHGFVVMVHLSGPPTPFSREPMRCATVGAHTRFFNGRAHVGMAKEALRDRSSSPPSKRTRALREEEHAVMSVADFASPMRQTQAESIRLDLYEEDQREIARNCAESSTHNLDPNDALREVNNAHSEEGHLMRRSSEPSSRDASVSVADCETQQRHQAEHLEQSRLDLHGHRLSEIARNCAESVPYNLESDDVARNAVDSHCRLGYLMRRRSQPSGHAALDSAPYDMELELEDVARAADSPQGRVEDLARRISQHSRQAVADHGTDCDTQPRDEAVRLAQLSLDLREYEQREIGSSCHDSAPYDLELDDSVRASDTSEGSIGYLMHRISQGSSQSATNHVTDCDMPQAAQFAQSTDAAATSMWHYGGAPRSISPTAPPPPIVTSQTSDAVAERRKGDVQAALRAKLRDVNFAGGWIQMDHFNARERMLLSAIPEDFGVDVGEYGVRSILEPIIAEDASAFTLCDLNSEEVGGAYAAAISTTGATPAPPLRAHVMDGVRAFLNANRDIPKPDLLISYLRTRTTNDLNSPQLQAECLWLFLAHCEQATLIAYDARNDEWNYYDEYWRCGGKNYFGLRNAVQAGYKECWRAITAINTQKRYFQVAARGRPDQAPSTRSCRRAFMDMQIELCQDSNLVVALLKEAKLYFAVTWEFDRNPYIIQCQNGVVDLCTNTVRRGRPTDFSTKCSDVVIPEHVLVGGDLAAETEAEKKTRKEVWDTLKSIFRRDESGVAHPMDQEPILGNTDAENFAYFARLLARMLVGKPLLKAVYFYGPRGRNSKSLVEKALRKLFGTYAGQCSSTLFKNLKGDDERNAAISLSRVGLRLLFGQELDAKEPLSNAVMKKKVGCDWESGTKKRSNEVVHYDPQYTICFGTNHPLRLRDPPIFSEADRAIIVYLPNKFLDSAEFDDKGASLSPRSFKKRGNLCSSEFWDDAKGWALLHQLLLVRKNTPDLDECVDRGTRTSNYWKRQWFVLHVFRDFVAESAERMSGSVIDVSIFSAKFRSYAERLVHSVYDYTRMPDSDLTAELSKVMGKQRRVGAKQTPVFVDWVLRESTHSSAESARVGMQKDAFPRDDQPNTPYMSIVAGELQKLSRWVTSSTLRDSLRNVGTTLSTVRIGRILANNRDVCRKVVRGLTMWKVPTGATDRCVQEMTEGRSVVNDRIGNNDSNASLARAAYSGVAPGLAKRSPDMFRSHDLCDVVSDCGAANVRIGNDDSHVSAMRDTYSGVVPDLAERSPDAPRPRKLRNIVGGSGVSRLARAPSGVEGAAPTLWKAAKRHSGVTPTRAFVGEQATACPEYTPISISPAEQRLAKKRRVTPRVERKLGDIATSGERGAVSERKVLNADEFDDVLDMTQKELHYWATDWALSAQPAFFICKVYSSTDKHLIWRCNSCVPRQACSVRVRLDFNARCIVARGKHEPRKGPGRMAHDWKTPNVASALTLLASRADFAYMTAGDMRDELAKNGIAANQMLPSVTQLRTWRKRLRVRAPQYALTSGAIHSSVGLLLADCAREGTCVRALRVYTSAGDGASPGHVSVTFSSDTWLRCVKSAVESTGQRNCPFIVVDATYSCVAESYGLVQLGLCVLSTNGERVKNGYVPWLVAVVSTERETTMQPVFASMRDTWVDMFGESLPRIGVVGCDNKLGIHNAVQSTLGTGWSISLDFFHVLQDVPSVVQSRAVGSKRERRDVAGRVTHWISFSRFFCNPAMIRSYWNLKMRELDAEGHREAAAYIVRTKYLQKGDPIAQESGVWAQDLIGPPHITQGAKVPLHCATPIRVRPFTAAGSACVERAQRTSQEVRVGEPIVRGDALVAAKYRVKLTVCEFIERRDGLRRIMYRMRSALEHEEAAGFASRPFQLYRQSTPAMHLFHADKSVSSWSAEINGQRVRAPTAFLMAYKDAFGKEDSSPGSSGLSGCARVTRAVSSRPSDIEADSFFKSTFGSDPDGIGYKVLKRLTVVAAWPGLYDAWQLPGCNWYCFGCKPFHLYGA